MSKRLTGILFAALFLMDWLQSRTRATPDKIALIFENERHTYAGLNRQVNGMVAFLQRLGIRSGDLVPVLSPNSSEYVCLVHALARLGAILVPLNTRLTSRELEWQLDHIGARWLLYDGAMAEMAQSLSASGRIVEAIDRDQSDGIAAYSRASKNPSAALGNLHSVVFTSGTTGTPKGVMLTYASHFWSATASAFRLGLSPDDRWLSCLPLYHVGGLAVILRSCLYGTAVVLHDGFDTERINEALEGQNITLVSLVPTMLHRLMPARSVGAWSGSLRLVLLGGAAALPDLITRSLEQGVPVATTYGLTEAASQVATMLPNGVRRKPGSVGKPLMFTSVRIRDERGRSLPAGELGEVVISGPTLMSGYFNDQSGTSENSPAGEFNTGDIGYLDSDGDLWLVQRRSDIILTGGEKVYPSEVEAVLREHPAVQNVCVVGVDDEEWGQRVAAMIVSRSGHPISESELIQFCRERLAGYKLPRRFQFVSQMPQTSSGKIHRQAVAGQLHEATAINLE